MPAEVVLKLHEKLSRAGVGFRLWRHEPVFTSEQAAAVRGVPLSSGAKALVVKGGDAFYLLVLPADRKLDSKRAKQALGVKELRFATREEVMKLTGLEPGAIPPFGSLFDLPTVCDPALGANPSINFNAGDHAVSMSLTYAAFVTVERPTLAELTAA
jgi:prolyl-tRNA editing enzyme YbaK/EbsC (Cys-tRNA(Pro) deacylase)